MSTNNNENNSEDPHVAIDYTTWETGKCIDLIISVQNFDKHAATETKEKYELFNLTKLKASQLHAMSFLIDGRKGQGKLTENGKLHVNEELEIPSPAHAETIISYHKLQIQHAKSILNKQQQNNQLPDQLQHSSIMDGGIFSDNKLMEQGFTIQNFGARTQHRPYLRGGQYAPTTRITAQSSLSNSNTNSNGNITGHKRNRNVSFAENTNSNNGTDNQNTNNVQNNTTNNNNGNTNSHILSGFEAAWDYVKNNYFHGFHKITNANGNTRYFWWKNGEPMVSCVRPLGSADGDDIDDPSFHNKLRDDPYFTQFDGRNGEPAWKRTRYERVCK